jgi:hypothetical protein
VGPTRGWWLLGNRPPAPTGRARRELGAGGWAEQQAESGGEEGAGRGSWAAPRKSQRAAGGGGVAGWAARGSWLAVPPGGLAGWLGRAKETSPGGRGFFLFSISYLAITFY